MVIHLSKTEGRVMGADLYNQGTYLANNPQWHQGDSTWKADHIDAILARGGIEPTSYVEVGCGAGGIIAAMAARHPQASATGFDISADAARLWPTQRPPNLDYRIADFRTTDGRYDVLLLIDVFEHVDDYLGFLRALRPRAKHFVFHVPLDLSALSVLRGSFMAGRVDVGHLHYFTRASALATLELAGYRVEDSFLTSLSIEASRDKRTWKTNIANLPRRLIRAIDIEAAATLLGGFSLIVRATAAPQSGDMNAN